MNKFVKIVLWLVGALVLLVVVLAIALPLLFDPNDHKDRIEAAVTDATGRDFAIQGDIGWSLFPNIGFDASNVTLANAPGLTPEHILRAERASVSVALLPLLSKRVEIGEVAIASPAIDLHIDASGTANWDSIMEQMANDSPSTEEEASGDLDLSIESISLSDGSVRYRDLRDGTDLQLSFLSLNTGGFDADSPLDLDLSADFRMGDALDGSLALESQIANLLNDAGITVTASELKLDSTFMNAPFQLGLDDPASIDLGKDTASIPSATLRFGPSTMVVGLEGSKLLTQPDLRGSFNVEQFDLRDLLNEIGIAVDDYPSNAFSSVGLSGDMSYQDGRVALAIAQGEFDDTTFSGRASHHNDQIKFDVQVGALNLDNYLPEGSSTEEAGSGDSAEVVLPKVDGSLKVASLQYAGMTASDVTLTVVSTEDGLKVFPLTAQLYGGALNGQLEISGSGDQSVARIRQNLDSINAQPLLADLLGNDVLSGLGNLDLQVEVPRPFEADAISRLQGTLDINFNDGAIYGLDVLGIARDALVALDKIPPAESEDEDLSKFTSFALSGGFESGKLRQEITLKSALFDMQGSGALDLVSQSLDMKLRPILINGTQMGGDGKEIEGMEIPVKLGGSLSDPKVEIDIARLALAYKGKDLDAGERELLEAVSGDKSSEEKAKSILGGLLNRELEKREKKKEKSKQSKEGDGNG